MYKRFGKRLIDICVSLICIPIFVVIFIFLAPAIYLTDKGPIFYNAERLGKGGRKFRMYKFRSMRVNAPDLRNADGSTFNSSSDPRVTKIGHLIRKTSLDETPQIFNVLKGDMSIVGPRPDLPTALEKYTYTERRKLEIRPGITGYNQAFFRNTVAWKECLEHDVYYVDQCSLSFDMNILVKTVQRVLMRKGVNKN